MKRLNCKFVDRLIVPANAISTGRCVTNDGVECNVSYICTWKNSDGKYDAELEEACQRYHGCSFSFIKSVWISRLGSVSDYWHLAKLINI